jgi:hypothetical protein
MTSEKKGFDAGELYDEGMREAGLSPDDAVPDSPGKDDSANVVSQVSEEKPKEKIENKASAEPEKKTKTEPEKVSPEDIESALKSTGPEETQEQVESAISALLPKEEDVRPAKTEGKAKTGYVPLDDHIKLRERAQRAERELDEIRQRQTVSTPTGGEKPGEAEKSPLEKFVDENPDEDIVPAKVQLEDRKWHESRQQKIREAAERAERAEREENESRQRNIDSLNSLRKKSEDSETAFRKVTPDYDKITKPICNAGLLSESDRLAIFKDANPAQKLYEICKIKADAIAGISGKAPEKAAEPSKTETSKDADTGTAADEELTDDQIYEEVKDIFGVKEES